MVGNVGNVPTLHINYSFIMYDFLIDVLEWLVDIGGHCPALRATMETSFLLSL